MSEKKTLEAEEHMRLAAKALKTGFLKWSPDYDTAGDEYSRAATAFKVTVILFLLLFNKWIVNYFSFSIRQNLLHENQAKFLFIRSSGFGLLDQLAPDRVPWII